MTGQIENKIYERDLYEPVKIFLENLDFVVKAEVRDCDIVAIKDDTVIIVELKTSFNLKLLYQALDRKSVTENVYVSIPRPKKGIRSSSWRSMINLLKKLEIGLITVALDSETKNVEVVLEPFEGNFRKNTNKKNGLLKEFAARNIGENQGGVNKTKLITAYREKSIEAACVILKLKQASVKDLKSAGLEGNLSSILNANYYKWFEKVDKGIYKLSKEGKKALKEPGLLKIAEFYKKKHKNISSED